MSTKHPNCRFSWCCWNKPGEHRDIDHTSDGVYVPASLIDIPETPDFQGETVPVIGVGTRFDHEKLTPGVWVHLNGKGHDNDCQMRIDEALVFRAALDKAIAQAVESIAGAEAA